MTLYKSDLVASLANQLIKYRDSYYKGAPLVSDEEYDHLESQLKAISPHHPIFSQVGTDSGGLGKKVPHKAPMLSLAKTYSLEELLSWQGEEAILGTWKIDGNSLSLVYKKGQLVQAKTRGNGTEGEEVTQKIQWVTQCVPKVFQTSDDFEVRGELFCTSSDFVLLAQEMERLGLEKPTNPRNIVAGILGRKQHLSLARFFRFFAFDLLMDRAPFTTEQGKFELLQEWGFLVPPCEVLQSKSQVESYLDQVKEKMMGGEVGLDGAVFTFNRQDLHDKLGSTSHHPRYKMSFKWQGETAETKIREISWVTSRLGVVTPVALVDPVLLSGAQISNVTLHNAGYVKCFSLKAGDQIEIIRSGEVIPKFLKVVQAASGESRLPTSCPSCQTKLLEEDIRLRCMNRECSSQVLGRLMNWVKAAQIEGLSEKRLTALMDHGFLKDLADLYTLTVEDFLKLPATKEKLASKLFGEIQKSKKVSLSSFLKGIGIVGGGKVTWEKLLSHFPSLEALQKATPQEIQVIDGFAEKTGVQITQGLKDKSLEIKKLLEVGVQPFHEKTSLRVDGPLQGMSFVLTGTMSQSRSAMKNLILAKGGSVVTGVSSSITALVCSDPSSSSSKAKKARQLGVSLWSEKRLMEEINQDHKAPRG